MTKTHKSCHSTKAALLASILCSNVHEISILNSICISIQIDEKSRNDIFVEQLKKDLGLLFNKKARYSLAKKSNSERKLRKGMLISLTISLHGKQMIEFLNNIFLNAIKNLRDFSGFFLESFDFEGNYTFSNLNRLAFSEIEFNENFRTEHLIITFKTSSQKAKNSLYFFNKIGFPFFYKK